MCTAYAVRQHRLSVLVKVFSRSSRARTGAAQRPGPRAAGQRSSTEREGTTGSLLAPRSGAPVVSDLRSVSRQTRSCIPRSESDAPGRTSGSRRIHVPHDRRPTAPTSSTPSHAARRASRTRRAGCRIGLSAARHTATLAAWSPAVNRAMNRYQRSPKSANTRRNIVTCERVRIPRPIARSRTGTRRSGFGQGHAHGIPVLRDAPESRYTVRGPQLTQQCTVHTIHT